MQVPKWMMAYAICSMWAMPLLRAQSEPGWMFQPVSAAGRHTAPITCLFQDSRGFLWIGSEFGLSRFDGRQYKRYQQIGKTGLTDLNIKSIVEDAQGQLWIGTEFGINKLNPYTETITRYYEGTGAGRVPFRWCNALYVDRDQQLWFASEKGVARYDAAADSFINYSISVYGADFKINKFIVRMMEDSRRRFWLATSYGVKLFDRATGTYQSLHTPETNSSLRENVIYSLHEDSRGVIWAGTYAGGLLRYDENSKRFVKAPCSRQMEGRLVVNDLRELTWGQRRVLALATNEGFFYLPHDTSRLMPLTNAPTDLLNCILPSTRQQLWAGGNKGLYRINLGHPAYTFVPQLQGKQEQFFHIIPHVKNTHQYFITKPGGWQLFDAPTKTLTPIALPAAYTNLLGNINQWQSDENGYWFTSSEGFGYYDVGKNTVTDYSYLILQRSAQKRTWHLAKDRQGKLWISMRRSGILVFDPATRQSTVLFGDSSRPDNIYGHSVNDLQYGPDANIYFTCRNDMYEVNSATYRYKKYAVQDGSGQIAITKISPRTMVFSKQGQLLVASNLQVLLLQNGQWQNRYPQQGYSSFLIDKMTGDASDNLFIYTAGTVLKTNPAFRSFANLQQLVGTSIATVTDIRQYDDSTWLLAQLGGIGILKTLDTEQRSTAPAPIISRVKYGSTEQYLLQRQSNPLRLHFQDALEIDIASPALTNHEDCQLLYKLDGIDTAWKEMLQTSTVRYDQLAPGHYTFMAKTLEPDGVASSVASFQFQIVPPFYKTWWFLLLAAAAAFATVFLYFRLQLQKALAIEKMRTKLATDLHDDIGATLSSIAMYSEAVQKQVNPTLPHLQPVLQKMGDSSRTMVTAMSDIVWAINPANDAGDKLLQRMENYARDLCAMKEIPLSFTATDKFPAIKLSLEQRRNIYLIFKEALNNALKYAGANHIRIHFTEHGKAWQLEITDDGIGFDTSRLSTGNGLKNMEKRAKEIAGHLHIASKTGKGTSITLLFST